MTREIRRADEILDDTCVVENGTCKEIVKAFTVAGRTTLIDSNGESWRVAAATVFELATQEEVEAFDRDRDRERVAEALVRLAKEIRTRKLVVPSDLADVTIGMELPDDADLAGWGGLLRATPKKVQGRLLPSIDSTELGIGVRLFGGSTWEFGPDLDGEPVGTVEQEFGPMYAEKRPSYDANPTVRIGDPHAYEQYAASLDESNPGWWKDDTSRMALGLAIEARKRSALDAGYAVSDGHRPRVDEDAMRADLRYEKTED